MDTQTTITPNQENITDGVAEKTISPNAPDVIIASTPTKSTSYLALSNWITNINYPKYFCTYQNQIGEKEIILVNPQTGEIFPIPIPFRDILGYFWFTEKNAIGMLNKDQRTYSMINLVNGEITNSILTEKAIQILSLSIDDDFLKTIGKEYFNPIPLYAFQDDSNNLFLIRNEIFSDGHTVSNNKISQGNRFFIYDVLVDKDKQITTILVYDILLSRDMIFKFEDIIFFDSNISWSPSEPDIVLLGTHLFDINQGEIVDQITGANAPIYWSPTGTQLLYNTSPVPYSITNQYDYQSSPCTYDLTSKEQICYDEIRQYFNNDYYELAHEIIYNLSWLPDGQGFGFSYFGERTSDQLLAGGFCLFDLQTRTIDCFTDDIQELSVGINDQDTRDAVSYTQWSADMEYIALSIQFACPYCDDIGLPRILFYQVEDGSYNILNNVNGYYLGIWNYQ